MDRLNLLLKQSFRRAGLEVKRWPDPYNPWTRLAKLIKANKVATVLDIGANVGDYAASLREYGIKLPIVSFEPIDAQWSVLQRRASRDPHWHVVKCALGDSDRNVTIQVAANRGASSSILPMLDRHKSVAPHATYERAEEVEQLRLDSWARTAPEDLDISSQLFMKLDVQGYEPWVLLGAEDTLNNVIGIQMELSVVPLYQGDMNYRDALVWMDERGFQLRWIEPGLADPINGEQLQFDAAFFR